MDSNRKQTAFRIEYDADAEEIPTILLPPSLFKEGLGLLPLKRKFGDVLYGRDCPVARFLTDQGYENVFIGGKHAHYNQEGERHKVQLPRWVVLFYFYDCYAKELFWEENRFPTVSDALKRLESVRKELKYEEYWK